MLNPRRNREPAIYGASRAQGRLVGETIRPLSGILAEPLGMDAAERHAPRDKQVIR
jgi:hypothetical protein